MICAGIYEVSVTGSFIKDVICDENFGNIKCDNAVEGRRGPGGGGKGLVVTGNYVGLLKLYSFVEMK
jgi:hypothetical protein